MVLALATLLLIATCILLSYHFQHYPMFHPDILSSNHFLEYIKVVVKSDPQGRIGQVFHGQIQDVSSLSELQGSLAVIKKNIHLENLGHNHSHYNPEDLFSYLGFPLDPACISHKSKWYYRTPDGSCNWLKAGESNIGSTGYPRQRDFDQSDYKDGISEPREGPNAREISNAFFKRKERIAFEHTPVLLGLIEFVIHDITYSEDSQTEFINVPVPTGDEHFDPHGWGNITLRVQRTLPLPGSGTDKSNPRQHRNMATSWLDASSLYGSNEQVSLALRLFVNGKLNYTVGPDGSHYLPLNYHKIPLRTKPGVEITDLFAGGDARTNEDWVMLVIHTLLLREHNRLCDIVVSQHLDWDDERVYQTVRLLLSSKIALIANSYQMAYWTSSMPWPQTDGFSLFRQVYGKDVVSINPLHTYPWPTSMKNNRPIVASAEMAIGYRFHELIIPEIPLINTRGQTTYKSLFKSAFDSHGFMKAGLDSILRGMASTDISNFKSGVDEDFRSAGDYRSHMFDIVTWSIVHEREQGVPTFNRYFRAFMNSVPKPAVQVSPRETFEDFSTDPFAVEQLKRLYKSPDDVDLTVGLQLDEEGFPGAEQVPKSALIISLLSLFGVGNADRFQPGYSINVLLLKFRYAVMRCLLIDTPWDCHPTNALEEMIWEPSPLESFPNARWFSSFWMKELDFPGHGQNLLWRLISENSGVKCLQKNPLFPVSQENPVVCSLDTETSTIGRIFHIATMPVYLAKNVIYYNTIEALVTGISAFVLLCIIHGYQMMLYPPVLHGLPLFGMLFRFANHSKYIIESGIRKFGGKAFGFKLAGLKYFVSHNVQDIKFAAEEYDAFSAKEYFKLINFDVVVGAEFFESEIYTMLIRENLLDPRKLARFLSITEEASKAFLCRFPFTNKQKIDIWLQDYMVFVLSRLIVGEEKFDDPQLLTSFRGVNNDAISAMGFASLLPQRFKHLAGRKIRKHLQNIRNILIPVIKHRRKEPRNYVDFLRWILRQPISDEKTSDLAAIILYVAFINLVSALPNAFYDIIQVPGYQDILVKEVQNASVNDIKPHHAGGPWNCLRGSVYESLRMASQMTGPARLITKGVNLPSDPKVSLPVGSVFSLSAYLASYNSNNWGADWDTFKPRRFHSHRSDRYIKAFHSSYLAFGLGRNMCPGRFFGVQTIMIMLRELMLVYKFESRGQDVKQIDKYTWKNGQVVRKEVQVDVISR